MLFETFGNRQNPAVLFFFMPMGMAAAMLVGLIGNHPFTNAVSCAWISIGNLRMFGGLLTATKKLK